MSGERPPLQPVAPGLPRQGKLPLPDPPQRPFVALARESRVGGPVRKLVYMVLATYCPVMAYSWVATGRIRRETLRQACELKKMDNLDTNLRQLRADGFISWTRTPGASVFEVRLSPLRVLEAMEDSRKRFGHRAVSGPASSDARQVSPSKGETRGVRGPVSPLEGEPKATTGGRVSPLEGDTALLTGQVSPLEGGSRGIPPAITSPGGALVSAPADSGFPLHREFYSPSKGELGTPLRGGVEVAYEVAYEVSQAAAGAVALVRAEPAEVPQPLAPDRRFKLLEVAADRLFAARARTLWLKAPDAAVQAQIAAAVRYRDGLKWHRHDHRAEEEILVSAGVDRRVRWKTVVQRCECGAVHFATVDRAGLVSEYVHWTLCGLVAGYVTDEAFYIERPPPSLACEPVVLDGWQQPLTWSDVDILVEKGGRDGAERLPAPAPVAPQPSSVPPPASAASSPRLVACPRCGREVQLPEVGVAGCVFCLEGGGG